MPVEIVPEIEIEVEPVLTEKIVAEIMGGKNKKLKAMLWNYLHDGVSRGRLGKNKAFEESPDNVLDGAEPVLNGNKHRGGSQANNAPGLRAFFGMSGRRRDRRGR